MKNTDILEALYYIRRGQRFTNFLMLLIVFLIVLFVLTSCANERLCLSKDVNDMTDREFEFCKAYVQSSNVVIQ